MIDMSVEILNPVQSDAIGMEARMLKPIAGAYSYGEVALAHK